MLSESAIAIPMDAPVVLILASGAGRRFTASGGRQGKLAALLAGRPVLEHTTAAAASSGLGWHVVRGIEGGMGSSIAAGVAATRHAAGWLILPADLPLIQPQSLCRVAALLRSHAVVVPHRLGTSGHPVGFGRDCLAALLNLQGENGARSVVQQQRQAGAVHDEWLDDDGMVMDIDTVDDLARAEAMLQTATSTGALHGKH